MAQRSNLDKARTDELASSFHMQVLRPLLTLANESPNDALVVIQTIRGKLDALETLLGDAEPLQAGRSVGTAPTVINGSGDNAAGGRDEMEDIGRNQRSRVREMYLLEALSSDARPFSLQQLMRCLEEEGFGDASAAVVSQLHRMKKVGIIEQPANGMYVVTKEGLGHLRTLKASFGALVKG